MRCTYLYRQIANGLKGCGLGSCLNIMVLVRRICSGDLLLEYAAGFNNFVRITASDFEELLQLVGPSIAKRIVDVMSGTLNCGLP